MDNLLIQIISNWRLVSVADISFLFLILGTVRSLISNLNCMNS